MFESNLLVYACRVGVLLLLLPIHEYAHARVALALGDPTAQDAGRVNLNPFVHLDFVGSLLLVLAGFGWAKPVPVDARYFRRPRRDMALVAMAGPLANLLMALLLIAGAQVVLGIARSQSTAAESLYILMLILEIMAQISVSLAVFNLLPMPPLDGSRMLAAVLPAQMVQRYYRYGEALRSIFLLILLFTPLFDRILMFFTGYILDFLVWVTSFIPMLF